MIKECQSIFEEFSKGKGDKLIIDNYNPKDGTYILVQVDGDKCTVKNTTGIKFNKKDKELVLSDFFYEALIRELEYKSRLIDMNKPIDPTKTVHTNNYMAFAVKKESIKTEKLTDDVIKGYYNILKNPEQKYKKSKESLKLYKEVEADIGPVNKNLIEIIERWVLTNYRKLNIDLEKKDYLKIFFILPNEENTRRAYEKESIRYILPNLYNSNDYNLDIGGETFGLPNNNLGMNSKKIYMANKMRGNTELPYILNRKEALAQAKFFDYLTGLASGGYYNIYFDDVTKTIQPCKNTEKPKDIDSGYYLRLQMDKSGVIIHNYQIISHDFGTLNTPMKYKKYFKDIKNNEDEIVSDKNRLEELVNEVFFSKYLCANYYLDPQKMTINNDILKQNILLSREEFFRYFYIGSSYSISPMVKKVGWSFVQESIVKGFISKSRQQCNLMLSLLRYTSNEESEAENIMNVRMQLLSQVRGDKDIIISNEEEYYYAIGQLIMFFFSKSKSKNKPFSKLNQYLNLGNPDIMVELIKREFMHYNYAIDTRNKTFKRLYSSVLLFKADGKVDKKMIMAGMMDNNVLMMRKEDKDE